MPLLKRLSLLHCPKLRALPQDLHRAANLSKVRIAYMRFVDLPAVVWLKVKHNRSLTRIANLSKLEDLFVQDCPALDQAENLGKLKRLEMVGCAKAEQFRRCLLEEEPSNMVHRRMFSLYLQAERSWLMSTPADDFCIHLVQPLCFQGLKPWTRRVFFNYRYTFYAICGLEYSFLSCDFSLLFYPTFEAKHTVRRLQQGTLPS